MSLSEREIVQLSCIERHLAVRYPDLEPAFADLTAPVDASPARELDDPSFAHSRRVRIALVVVSVVFFLWGLVEGGGSATCGQAPMSGSAMVQAGARGDACNLSRGLPGRAESSPPVPPS